jgi:hypothetical protein
MPRDLRGSGVSDQHPRRAAEEASPTKAATRPGPPQLPTVDPRAAIGGIKGFLQRRADPILDWYAAQSKTLRVGLLGGVGAFSLIGVVAAASSALTPTPVSAWASVPGSPASSLSVRVNGSAGPVPSSAGASSPGGTTTQLPSATETSSESASSAATGTHKPTGATTQQTTGATQGPGSTTAPAATVPSTTSGSTAASPTSDPPSSNPPTTDPPTTVAPTSGPPTSDPPTVDPPTSAPPTVDPPTTDPPTDAP